MTRRGWLLFSSSVLCAAGATAVGAVVGLRLYRPAKREPQAEEQLLELINAKRKIAKYWKSAKSAKEAKAKKEEVLQVPPLAEDESLQQVAQEQARSMGRNQSMAFIPEEQLKQELEKVGYPYAYMAVVPDLVCNMDLKDAFESWMDDEKHQKTKELLLNPYFDDIGVGVYKDGTEDAYYLFLLLAKKKK